MGANTLEITDSNFETEVLESAQPVLVDFWAPWCGPCKKAFPELIKLQKKYESRGFTVVGVSIDEDKSDMDKFLKKNPVPFPILRDSEGKKLGEKVGVVGLTQHGQEHAGSLLLHLDRSVEDVERSQSKSLFIRIFLPIGIVQKKPKQTIKRAYN